MSGIWVGAPPLVLHRRTAVGSPNSFTPRFTPFEIFNWTEVVIKRMRKITYKAAAVFGSLPSR